MSNFEETFKALLLEFIKRRNIDAREITSYEDNSRTESWGGCETCGGDEQVYEVDIFYTDGTMRGCYTYSGSFSNLLGELIELDGKEAE